MDREGWKAAVGLARLKDTARERVDLDRADAAVTQQRAGQDAAADAGEQV